MNVLALYSFVFSSSLLWASVSTAPVVSHGGGGSNNNTNKSTTPSGHGSVKFEIATFDYEHVSGPFMIMVWILIASFAKLGFHLSPRLSSIFPESSMVICLGIVIGGIFKLAGHDAQLFTSKVFFLFMLPPIVLEAGYFLQDKAFFDNIGTVLLYAVVGTLFNAFLVGLSLYGTTVKDISLPLMHYLVFGALIAAVDPVAVLAVFEEVKVNTMLYILVFGESLLNDAVTVVLYHLFEKMAQMEEVTYKEVFKGLANFLVVSICGTLMGLLWGLATAFVTKYTDHVRVIEPIFVIIMSYLAYLSAEMFHFSGIMSIMTCAIIMKPYVERNISRKSHTTLKYVMKMLSSCSETLIFMFLGVSLVTYSHSWSTVFVLWTLFYVAIFRTLGVLILTYFANRFGRLNKLSLVDQFVMCYGGIRGAVSFSLAILLTKEHFPAKDMIVTTTIVVVMFTVFIQGTTIKPLVKVLQVKLLQSEEKDMYAQLNDKLFEHLVAGMEEITGHRGHRYYWELAEHIHNQYLRRWFVRENESCIQDEDILLAYRKLEYKDALQYLEREGSGSLLFSSASGHHLQTLAQSSVSNSEGMDDNEPLLLRGGAFVRVPDSVVRDSRASTEPSESSVVVTDTPHNLSNLLVRSRKTYSHRKFQRNNVVDNLYDDMMSSHRSPYPSQPLRFKVPPALSEPKPKHHKHSHKHRHRKRRRHGKGQELEGFPPKKKLSTIFEPEDDESKAEQREHDLAEKPKDNSKDDQGITFTAGAVRWKIGRQVSEEETEREKKAKERSEKEKEDSTSSSSGDDSSTGDELEKGTTLETVDEEHLSVGARKEDTKQGDETEGASTSHEESVPLVNVENGSLDRTEDGSEVSNGSNILPV